MKLKRFKEGVWVDYPKAKEVRFKIRPVTFSQSLSILSEVKEKRVVVDYPDSKDPSKKGPQIVDDYKDGAFLWKMFDQALEAWDGITVDQDEGEAPLGPMEIKKVIFDNNDVREFIFESARNLLEAQGKKEEEERKN